MKEAFDAYERARRSFDELSVPYEAARCRLEQSRTLGRSRDPGERARAAELEQAARRALEALGAADAEA